MNVYFISGMGGDRRLFKYIRLPAAFQPCYLDWIPFEEGETLSSYAARLSAKINSGEPFILVGMSLGGIVAVEIAKRLPPACTIMIGSVPISAQLPPYYKLARRLRLIEPVPASFFKFTAMVKRLFTSETREDKRLIRQMIRDSDPAFIKWAMQAVLEWDNAELPAPFWHLHGTHDIVFPIRMTRPTHAIKKGRHLLVITHWKEVNALLGQLLSPYTHSTRSSG